MKYQPIYAKGEIFVRFKDPFGPGFAEEWGSYIGYELSDETTEGDYFIFKTEEGKENEALKKFESYPEFVDWGELRDLKLESRVKNHDEAIEMIDEFSDLNLPDDRYNKKLEDVIHYLEKLKQ